MNERIHVTVVEGKDLTVIETNDGYKTPLSEPKGWLFSTHQYRFPKDANVYLHETEETYNSKRGKPSLLYMAPPGEILTYNSYNSTSSEVKMLLGKRLSIYPDGSYSPSELLDILQFVEEELGYKIESEVLDKLKIGKSDLSVFIENL